MKKVLCTIINVISGLLIAVSLLILLVVFFTKGDDIPSIFGYSSFRVLTGSMDPTIKTNDLIITKKVEPESLKVGDIITFYSLDPEVKDSTVTHRIVAIQEEDGYRSFVTKGDANLIQDNYTVPEENIIGKFVFKSSLLGNLVHLASNPLVFIGFIVVPLLLIIIVNLIQTVKVAKKAAEEEEAELLQKIIEEKSGSQTMSESPDQQSEE